MKRSNFLSGTFHLIPENKISKFELIQLITAIFSRNDLNILRWDETELVDRSLGTEFKAFNEELWNDAGYLTPPTIKEMLEEYYNWLT
jgi:dTDP-4-dehydrorhamnose reductase